MGTDTILKDPMFPNQDPSEKEKSGLERGQAQDVIAEKEGIFSISFPLYLSWAARGEWK